MLLAADVTIPSEMLIGAAGAMACAIAWLAKAMLGVVRRADERGQKSHDEVVALAKEAAAALAENTAAIHEISGSMDELARSIRTRTSK